MKKILCVLLISLFSYTPVTTKNLYIGNKLENKLLISKYFEIDLSEGTWEVVRIGHSSGWGITQKIIGIARIENKEIMEMIEVYEGLLSGVLINDVDPIIIDMVFKNKYDGCYERPEYFLLELYRKGSTHNCMIVRHWDLLKELTNPDDPQSRGNASAYNYWIKDNSLIVPKIALASEHSYFSRLIRGSWLRVVYVANPKILDAPQSKFFSEENSEYSKYNINKYPDHKKTMEKWISISSKRHKKFEQNNQIKSRHELNLDNYINMTARDHKKKLSTQLKHLSELYKSGALTKEEFTKAKKKLIN